MTGSSGARRIRVRVRLPAGAAPPAGSILHVRVEDISRSDQPSTVVVERDVELPERGETLVIDVPAERIDPQADYNVFLHLDAGSSGEVESGDYLSPQIHPVLTHGASDLVEAELVRVK